MNSQDQLHFKGQKPTHNLLVRSGSKSHELHFRSHENLYFSFMSITACLQCQPWPHVCNMHDNWYTAPLINVLWWFNLISGIRDVFWRSTQNCLQNRSAKRCLSGEKCWCPIKGSAWIWFANNDGMMEGSGNGENVTLVAIIGTTILVPCHRGPTDVEDDRPPHPKMARAVSASGLNASILTFHTVKCWLYACELTN